MFLLKPYEGKSEKYFVWSAFKKDLKNQRDNISCFWKGSVFPITDQTHKRSSESFQKRGLTIRSTFI